MDKIPEAELLEVFVKKSPVLLVTDSVVTRKLPDDREEEKQQIILPQSLLKSNIPWFVERATIMSSPRVGVPSRSKRSRRFELYRGSLLSAYLKYEAQQVGIKNHELETHSV